MDTRMDTKGHGTSGVPSLPRAFSGPEVERRPSLLRPFSLGTAFAVQATGAGAGAFPARRMRESRTNFDRSGRESRRVLQIRFRVSGSGRTDGWFGLGGRSRERRTRSFALPRRRSGLRGIVVIVESGFGNA